MNQMKPVLDFIKAQVFLLVCAIVVLLALVSLWWPFGSMAEETAKDMKEAYNRKTAVEALGRSKRDFPGLVYKDSTGKVTAVPPGVVVDALTKLKAQASEEMVKQKKEIEALAAKRNRQNRVDDNGVPLFYGAALPGYLPHKSGGANYHMFREVNYKSIFDNWTRRLLGQSDLAAGLVPAAATLKDAAQKEARARSAEIPAELAGKAGYEPTSTDVSGSMRDTLVIRASSTPIYLNPETAFQKRGFIAQASEPTEQEVFDAFVDCWLQNDVVEAIRETNRGSAYDPKIGPEVGKSRIKNLLSITVSDSAGVGGRALPPGAEPAPTAVANSGAASLTQRVSNSEIDVMTMSVSMVAEPAAVNMFIDELYKRNNGYTVLNCKQVAVDPYEAASRGYIYGRAQCVQVELTIEVIFFKAWTSKLAPSAQ